MCERCDARYTEDKDLIDVMEKHLPALMAVLDTIGNEVPKDRFEIPMLDPSGQPVDIETLPEPMRSNIKSFISLTQSQSVLGLMMGYATTRHVKGSAQSEAAFHMVMSNASDGAKFGYTMGGHLREHDVTTQ